MYKEVLRSIDGVGVYPMISLVIFTTFFVGMLTYVVSMRKTHVNKMKHIPLDLQNGDTVSLTNE